MEVSRRQAGFTLIESLVAMSILLIGLLALAMLQNVAFKANTMARNRMAAAILASERIERLSRLGAANSSTGTAALKVDGKTFSETWTMTTAPTATNGSKTVDMVVNWSDVWGNQTVRFPTVVR